MQFVTHTILGGGAALCQPSQESAPHALFARGGGGRQVGNAGPSMPTVRPALPCTLALCSAVLALMGGLPGGVGPKRVCPGLRE